MIKEIIEACGGKVEAFVDDNPTINERAGVPVVNPNIEIGEWTIVGSASAVTGNVEPNITVAGVPARRI